MFRIRLMLGAMAVGAALVAPTTATTAPAPLLTGTVGPGATITLKKGGVKVRTVKAGRYRIRVSDKSDDHDFKLKGAVSKTITGVEFTGTKTVTVTLKKGTVTYFCAPHASFMKGSFKVT